MLRKCDGTDENLIRPDHAAADCPTWPVCKHNKPCDCGLEFDDVEHSVIYPHTYIPSREEKDRLFAAYEASQESGYRPIQPVTIPPGSHHIEVDQTDPNDLGTIVLEDGRRITLEDRSATDL